VSDWLISLEGTAAGHQVALGLALMAAFLHAVFGALQKGRHDPWLSRGAIDASYCLMAAPFAFFIVPWPEPHMWLIFLIAWIIHVIYKLLQAMAYTKGSYTVVYPVVRGTGPLFTVFIAWMLFGERFEPMQWVGVLVLLAGIFGLALYNYRHLQTARDTLGLALGLAVATGLTVALYTTFDAYGIRATADPFTLLAWFFRIDGLVFPVIAYLKLKDEVFTIGGTEYDGFILVTAGFVPLIIASSLILWKLTGKLSKMQIVTLVLVVVFGGLSVWFNDDRFFKMKPTLIYLLFGGVLGIGLLRGQSYLKFAMEEVLPMEAEGWMILTRRICGFFLVLALLYELVWRTQSTETWVYFKTFGLSAAVFLFFMTQGAIFQKYAIEEEES
jgi:intracellular septation protein A